MLNNAVVIRYEGDTGLHSRLDIGVAKRSEVVTTFAVPGDRSDNQRRHQKSVDRG